MELDKDIYEEFGEKAFLSSPSHRRDIEIFSASLHIKSFPAHEHEGFVIGIIDSGVQEFFYRNERHRVGANSITLLNPGELHTGATLKDIGVSYKTIHFPSSFLYEYIHPSFYFSRAFMENTPRFVQFINYHLERLNVTIEPSIWEQNFSIFIEALCQFLPHNHAFIPLDSYCPDKRIKELLRYIDFNLDLPLKIEELADKVGLSNYYFIRKFKDLVGFTPHAYIQAKRTSLARKMLMSAAKPADVASAVGFTDQSHLNKWLIASYGHGATPNYFRKHMPQRKKN